MIPQDLLDAIIANKSDDVPRLIAADWLDEHGECERAEFIRVQCDKCTCIYSHHNRAATCNRCHREDELLRNRRYSWIDGLLGYDWKTNGMDTIGCLVNFTNGSARTQPFNCTFRRGFISEIICQWNDWLTHADAILKATPLEKVRLTTIPERGIQHRQRLGQEWRLVIHDEYGDLRWPGIEFKLPTQNYIFGLTETTDIESATANQFIHIRQ